MTSSDTHHLVSSRYGVVVSLVTIALSLASSGCDWSGIDEYPPHNSVTNAGYRCWLPMDSSVDHDTLRMWIDIRVSVWLALRGPAYGYEGTAYLAGSTTYRVVDDYRFPSAWSPTGWAVGEINTWSKHPTLKAAIYDCGPGLLPPDGMGLIVISHELDHRLGISH